jgi:hypothetical protein
MLVKLLYYVLSPFQNKSYVWTETALRNKNHVW